MACNGRFITKSELIGRLSKRQNSLPRRDVKSAVNSILEHMSHSLSRGERIEIRGFGSFSLRHRKARMARNPKTGALVLMAGKSIPYFKAGKLLRDRVQNPAAFPSPELHVEYE